MPPFAAAVASYLLGSVPWGLLLVRLVKGIDLRTVGSGNIGATNAMRAGGKPLGLIVFALDFLKGWGAVALLARAAGEPSHSWVAVLCGAAAVIGHCFPIWLRVRGGKGVATGCGALVAMDPWIWVLGGAVWLIVLGASRMVSLASILMGLAFVAAAWYRTRPDVPPTVGAALLAVLILVRHRSNMARIVAGTEPRVFGERGGAGAKRG
jgi:acyl phosphate:glycerol-3-phosphate acyltransferase